MRKLWWRRKARRAEVRIIILVKDRVESRTIVQTTGHT